MKFYRFIAAFSFLKCKKLKKFVVALKCVYSLAALSLNSKVFFWFYLLEKPNKDNKYLEKY